MKVFCAVGLLVATAAALLAENAAATQFTVGGSSGWTVPPDNSPVYNHWAERMRFQIGDSLLFVYPSNSDSVLQVTKADYDSCNTASPLGKYTDGNTVFKFNHSGPFYFISGNRDNCHRNEKLVVVVMADRTKRAAGPAPATTPPASSPSTYPSPAPSPSATQTPSTAPVGMSSSPTSPPPSPSPAPSPSATQTPSPAPVGIPSSPTSPPPSPPPSREVNHPSPAPSTLSSPPRNDASSLVVKGLVVGSVGAFIGVALLIAF